MNVASFPNVTPLVLSVFKVVPVPLTTKANEVSPTSISPLLEIFWFLPVANTPTDSFAPTFNLEPFAKSIVATAGVEVYSASEKIPTDASPNSIFPVPVRLTVLP